MDGYTYFIFLTALADKAHLLEGLQASADDYLTSRSTGTNCKQGWSPPRGLRLCIGSSENRPDG